jgi:hypothetical protein
MSFIWAQLPDSGGGLSWNSDEASIMEVEQRRQVIQFHNTNQSSSCRRDGTKSVSISGQMVLEAYKREKANRDASGVDRVSMKQFKVVYDVHQKVVKMLMQKETGKLESYFLTTIMQLALVQRSL